MTIEHELRGQLDHHDREFDEFDERLTLDEMSHAELVAEVRILARRLELVEGVTDRQRSQALDRIHAVREHVENGRRLVSTFGGEIDVGPATVPVFRRTRGSR